MQDSTGQGALDRLCPAGVQNLLDIFAEAGVGAYPVGGCVRDALMGRTPHDWDIAVTCPPDRTVALCAAAGLRTVPTGIAHGTVTVLVPAPAGGRMPVECTTCRTETGYSDGRHPDSVAFSDRIQDDLSRRDFTVNAMAAERDAAGHFRVLDLFGGLDDLAGRIIRCVGDPERRLREDALRVLRGVRFSVRLGFEPEPDTRAALIRCAPELAHISGERVREELRGILTSPDPDRGVAMLYRLGLAPYVLPRPSGAAESLAQRGGFARLDGFPSRLAALLWGLSEPDLEADLRRLRLSGEETQRVRARLALAGEWRMIYFFSSFSQASAAPSRYWAGELPGAALPLPEAARRLRARLGEDALPALAVRQGYAAVPAGLAEAVRRSADADDPVTLKQLALHGSHLPALGVPAGRETGRVLAFLLDSVLRDPSCNTPAALAALVRGRTAAEPAAEPEEAGEESEKGAVKKHRVP